MTDGRRATLVDGRPAPQGAVARLRRRGQRLVVSRAEHDEADLERRLLNQPGVTRANTVALMSPTGGVGKTTCTFVVANLLATHLKLRAVAVDANPGFGTLAQLAPDDRRSERGLADLLEDADHLRTAAELGAYVSRLPTGLHVLTARTDPEQTTRLGPDRYGEVVALLSCFYDVVLLDLGTGMVGPLARFAARRADQLVLVTTPDRAAAAAGLEALALLRRHERTTVAINGSYGDVADALEQRLLAERPRCVVTVPHDERLASMLESGTYTLGALGSPTRMAIKRLGLAVAELLV
jgi:MinD-like ATPase involved in chromosome partitioning or flagellar assembly